VAQRQDLLDAGGIVEAAGLRTLRSLVGPGYLARGTGAWSILLHGRHDPTYDDVGVTYGDYYLLQALLRVQLLPSDRPALRTASTRRLAGGGLRADLGGRRRVSAVSVGWAAGASTATRYRVQTSVDGANWTDVYATRAGNGGVDDLKRLGGSGRYLRVLATQRAASTNCARVTTSTASARSHAIAEA